VESIPGVSKAQVDLQHHTVTVRYDDSKTSVDKIAKVLSEKGYPPEGKPRELPAPGATQTNKNKMLIGRMTKEELYKEFPVFEGSAQKYAPKEEDILKIRNL
jgi:cation transport ATPase